MYTRTLCAGSESVVPALLLMLWDGRLLEGVLEFPNARLLENAVYAGSQLFSAGFACADAVWCLACCSCSILLCWLVLVRRCF